MSIVYIIRVALETGLIWGLLALGVFISYRVLDFADLSVEGTLVLGGAIAASLILSNNPFFSNPIVALVIALIGGMLAGVITGFLYATLKIPGILAGIITMTALYSINLLIMGTNSLFIGSNITIYDYMEKLVAKVFNINSLEWIKFISKILTSSIVVGIVILIVYYFFGTELGMSIRATGSNPHMARAQGINTNKMIILGLAISNGIVALAGALYLESYHLANMDLGRGSIVVGLASIIIGEVLIGKTSFKRWLIAVISGAVVFQVLIGFAVELNISAESLKLLQAILIAVILALPVLKPMIEKHFRRVKDVIGKKSNKDLQ